MKKLRLIMALTIAAAMLALSCTKENNVSKKEDVSQEESEFIPSEGDIVMNFSAEVEKDEESSKTAIDEDGNVSWVENDEVRIYWTASDYAVASAASSGVSTVFNDVSVGSSEYYYAVYPAVESGINPASQKVTVTVPASQNGAFADVNYMVARTLSGGSSLKFYYMCSVVKFNILRSDISEVTLRSADGSAIAGSVTADYSAVSSFGDTPVFTTTDGADEISIAISGPGTYYAAILPGKAIAGGLLFRCKTTSGDYLPAAATAKNQSSHRGRIKNYIISGGMDSKIITDYYVTESGSGSKNGKSLSDAFDPASFRNFIHDRSADEEASRSQAFRLYGTTFHCTGSIALSNGIDGIVRLAFCGNAYEKPVAFTISGGTLVGGSAYNILRVADNVSVSFDGVTFSGGYSNVDNPANYGAALNISSASAKVSATNCSFTGNTAVDGGAVYIGAGTFQANACTFTSNSASRYGGCFSLNGSNAVLFLNKCKVFENSAASWGTTVNSGAGSTLAMNATVFYDNSSTGGNDASMVLKSNTLMTNCTLIENVGTYSVIRLEGTALSYLANNIILATNASKDAVYMNSSSHNVVSRGGNLIGKLSGANISSAQAFGKNFSDVYNFKYSEMNNVSWNSASGALSWDNSEIGGFHPYKLADVNNTFSLAANGFSAWLSSVDANALTQDISGNPRTHAGLRPGAWEGSKLNKSTGKPKLQHLMAYYQWGTNSKGVLVMSHRCHINSENQSENSISSGKQALQAGADILEVDPRITSDGEIVLCHNRSIENVINSTSQTSDVCDLTLAQIQSYELVNRKYFGSYWRIFNGTGESIPTLGQFLSGVAPAGTYYVCLDLDKVISDFPGSYMTIIQTIANIVNSAGMMDYTLFYVAKAGAAAGEDKATSLRNSFASWGYPDAFIYTFPYGNSPSTDCNYEWALNFPQYVYGAQASYSPGSSPHNLTYIAEDGIVGSVNMLNVLNSNIPEYGINSSYLDELLMKYPYGRIIHTDSPAELVSALTAKGMRPTQYENSLDADSNFEGYNENIYNW